MKGILLAGGSGTRLAPMTSVISKQLLPIYEKPMLYYPLSLLLLAGIRDILIISTPRDLPMIQDLMGDGSKLGVKFSYKVQPEPKGIAQAFILGEEFIGNSRVCLVLGDNIFYGQSLMTQLERTVADKTGGATIFGYYTKQAERYGVVEFDQNKKVLSIEEKPKQPKSRWAVTGLYFYDSDVVQISKALKPSPRGELEITDVNVAYMKQGRLKLEIFGRGTAWLDTGTPATMLSASQFVHTIEERQGQKVACLEEIAYRKGFIDQAQLKKLAEAFGSNPYGEYLYGVLEEDQARFG